MTEEDRAQQNIAAQDVALHRAPFYVVGGSIFGLLAGTLLGNLAYGVCAGVLLSIAAWFVSKLMAASKAQESGVPPEDA